MATLFSLPLNFPATAPNYGTVQRVSDIQNKWVQITAFAGSLNIEISLDNGSHYWPIVTGVTAPGLYEIPQPATHLRLRVLSGPGATPTGVVAGVYSADG